ncbi:MAG: hypothetical protein SVM86_01170 [Candidatus Cloacimonadota bacterium]|nr:hypothetical protein [Candidatus Cloacimonadota bacterium]
MKTSILFIFLVVSNLRLLGIINLEHSPPPGRNFKKNILTTDQFQEIKEVYFYYRETGELNYSKLEKFSASEPDIVFHLPKNIEISSGLEYYFKVKTKNNEFFTLPQQQVSMNPFRISLSPSKVKVEENFILLSPDTSFIEVIAISYFAIANKVEQESINLYVNEVIKNSISLSIHKQLAKSRVTAGYSITLNHNPSFVNYINKDRKWLKLEDDYYNYNSVYLKNRWDLLHEKFKPYVNLRLTNYNGEIDSQAAVSASGGTKYMLNESASLDWHNRVYVFSNYDDSCENWQEFETSLKINYNF